jgi:hypothetical protein
MKNKAWPWRGTKNLDWINMLVIKYVSILCIDLFIFYYRWQLCSPLFMEIR